jgi:hypothetical protein
MGMDPITISVGSLIALIILIATLVSIVRNPNHGVVGKFIWILVALLLNVVGSILWLIFGRGRVPKRR